jgi:hypothetical protein
MSEQGVSGRVKVSASGPRAKRAPAERPTSWWLAALRRRSERMYDEHLDLSQPIEWSSELEKRAAVAFFNAAFRSEESGLRQAEQLADEVHEWDPELAECLRLYGAEEGWHREILSEFLPYIGGEVKPMGRVTSAFYHLYGRAKRLESIVITNLMFETIGSTTYRLALRRAKHPAIRQLLTILTRDESFHVPLNVHFLRQSIKHQDSVSTPLEKLERKVRITFVYHLLFAALLGSAYASRRRAKAFDQIPFRELAQAYAKYLGGLFIHESDLGLEPPRFLLWLLDLSRETIEQSGASKSISVEAAEAAIDRERVAVDAL